MTNVKNVLRVIIVGMALVYSSAAFAGDVPTLKKVWLHHSATGWMSTTNFTLMEDPMTCGSFDYCTKWRVVLEQGTANSADQFIIEYYENDSTFDEPGYMWSDLDYTPVYDHNTDYGNWGRMWSDVTDIDWADGQYIAVVPVVDINNTYGMYVYVDTYIIGK